MLPILIRFTFESLWSQLLLYAVALGVVGYIAYNGWRGAEGVMSREGTRKPVQQADRVQRTLLYGGGGAVLAWLGLKYALPAGAFPGGQGEGIPIHTYGVLLASGFFCAVTVAARLAQDEWRKLEWVDGKGLVDTEGPLRREQILDLGFWVLVGGLVGSRVLFIIVNWETYSRDWTDIFSLGGGLVFYGGLIGAALAKDLFGRLTHTGSSAFGSQVEDPRYVITATGEVLHQAAPGAVRISQWVAEHGTTLPVHPTQLFESFGQLVLFVGLLWLRRFRRFHGHIFSLWLMAYAVLRTTVELFRGDAERGTLHGLLTDKAPSLAHWVPLEAWYNISTSQFISLCMFTFGATLLYQRSKQLGEATGLGPTPSAA